MSIELTRSEEFALVTLSRPDVLNALSFAPGYIVADLNREAMTHGPLADYLKKRIPSGTSGAASDVSKLVAALFSEDIPFLSGETIYIDGAQGTNH